jgi:hypothetical protein
MAYGCLEVVPSAGYHLPAGYHLGTTCPQKCVNSWANSGTRGWGTTWVPVGTGCEVVPTAPYTPYGGGAGTTPGYHQTRTPFYASHPTAPAAPRRHMRSITSTPKVIGGHMLSRIIPILSYATAAALLAWALVAAIR